MGNHWETVRPRGIAPLDRTLGQGLGWALTWAKEWAKTCRLGVILLSLSLVLSLGVGSAWATGVYDLPASGAQERVVDSAKLFSRLTLGELSRSLDELAKQTHTEAQFVTLRRLDYGETIESFAQALFESWFPDPASRSDRLLLALDVVTNTAAIAKGPNVSATLSDPIAQSIAQETILFQARDGNYNQAFLDAQTRLAAVLSGQPDPGAPDLARQISAESTFTKAEDTDRGSATTLVIVLLILATAIPMVTYFIYVR